MAESRAKICVPVCVSANDFKEAITRASAVGDVIELRLDCLTEDKRAVACRDLAATTKSPFILTLRPRDQGGKADVSVEDRLQFWSSLESVADRVMFDLELDLVDDALSNNSKLAASRVICSHHDLESGAADVDTIYDQMTRTRAAVFKIAVQADDAVDCLPIFDLLEKAKRDNREMIAVAMGQAGIMTRILGPSRGSFLTYGSLDDERATAPGQLTARALRDVYRIDNIDQETQIIGLIGRPVGHSISPYIHNAVFAESDLNAVFIPFEVRNVDAFIHRMVRKTSREIDWNVCGFSVTAPHKAAVMKHLDWIEPAAKEIGAVNTIVVQDEALHGYNTDAIGFLETLKARVESLHGLRCAVIGAGGAARGVVWALQHAGASVSLFARDAVKGKLFGDELTIDTYALAGAKFEEFDVVINATPLGTRGMQEGETPVEAEQLRGVRLAYDLVYNPLETRFMREAREAGCETIGGLEMLVRQAVEQLKLWTGVEPNIATMRMAAEKALPA